MNIGNEIKNHQKELSIQITLGGYSFLIATDRLLSSGEVEDYDFDSKLEGFYNLSTLVKWSVPSVLIIPFELFDHRYIDNYLLNASMLDKEKQRSLFAVRGNWAAVWSVEKNLYEYLNQRVPSAEHNHSLLSLLDESFNTPALCIQIDSASLLHIVLWSEYGLEAAHSVQIKSTEDILFYSSQLAQERAVENPILHIRGNIEESTKELLSKYYTINLE